MYKVLALDMDDTLLRSDGSIDAQTMELLAQWRDCGNHIVIATGRPPRSVGPSLPPLLQDVPWICYNGAVVLHGGATVYANLMEPDDVVHLVDWGARVLPEWRIGLEIDDVLYLNQPLTIRKEYVHEPDLLRVAARPAAKVLYSNGALNADKDLGDDMDIFAPLRPLLDDLPPRTRPMLSNRYRLAQFMSHSADKAVALAQVVDLWDLTMADVVAFGDDVNDVEMLRACGLGVAMDNSVAEVHAVADRVTSANDDGGIARVLATLLA